LAVVITRPLGSRTENPPPPGRCYWLLDAVEEKTCTAPPAASG